MSRDDRGMTVGDGYRTIGYDLSDGVATITLDRPDHMNAFTVRMCLEMIDAFDRVDDDPDVRAFLTKLGVPESHKVYGCAALGYAPADAPVKEKKVKEGTVTIIR